MSKLTSSITSTKASFLRYLTSARRHDRAPVACIVMRDESSYSIPQMVSIPRSLGRPEVSDIPTIARSDLTPSVVMYIFNVSVSVFWGYPKSSISAESLPS